MLTFVMSFEFVFHFSYHDNSQCGNAKHAKPMRCDTLSVSVLFSWICYIGYSRFGVTIRLLLLLLLSPSIFKTWTRYSTLKFPRKVKYTSSQQFALFKIFENHRISSD